MNDDMLTSQSLFLDPPRRDRVTTISGAVQRRPIVFVLGMHRSGTSLCSHILSALGVDMADDVAPTVGNAGHWERWEIAEFHERILRLFNRDYNGRFHDFALPVAWWADPRIAPIRREIVDFLEKRMGEGYFGFKDARTVRLMPVWHQIFNELRLAPRAVLCLRNPAQIALSLSAHDGLDTATGEYRWLVHMIDFFRYANGLDFCTVEYDEWFDNPSANAERLRKFLDLPWQQSESELDLILSDIIDPAGRPDGSGHREASQPLVRTLYKLASRAGQDGARDKISYIVSQFVSFQQLQRPFVQAFEDVAHVAAKYPEIEREAVALRAAVESAGHRANVSEARVADAAATIEGQSAQIARITRERDDHAERAREASGPRATLAEREAAPVDLSRRADELLGALQVAQAELETREAALRRAEREAQQRVAAAEALQSGLAALRETLDQAEREAQEQAAATAAAQDETTALRGLVAKAEQEAAERGIAAAAMEAEVETLRDALAQAERVGQEHTATAEAVQAEVMTLRDALSQAERVEREHAATAEATQAEVMALRDALSQAERVGREHAATAEATQAEVMALRDALSQAERVGREHTATAEAVQAEVMTLRNALAQAERDRHERAAAQEAMQREIGALRRAVVQDAQERVAATTAMRAEITELRDALARAEGAAREGANATAAMQGEITELRDALAGAEDAARGSADASVQMQAEIADLRGALAQAEEEARKGADASDAMQTEIADLRQRLAQAAQQEREHAAAASSTRTEITMLRSAVARAESAAQERDVACEAMEAEIASVRNQLAAAREVARVALASLQTDFKAMPESTPRAGWLTPILRLIGFRTAGRLL